MSTILSGNSQSIVVASNILSSASSGPERSTTIEVQQQTPGSAVITEGQQLLQNFWQNQLQEMQNVSAADFKVQDLPLARIKKIMKMDEDVKMISAEAPLLFAKAAQMFVTELSMRAWVHTEENKRRTLQRNDIATAITKFDQFDFLIDIVPREELKPTRRSDEAHASGTTDNMQYVYTLQNQPNQSTTVQTQTPANPTTNIQPGQIILAQPSGQVLQLAPNGQIISAEGNQHIIQIPQQQISQTQQPNNTIVVGTNNQAIQNPSAGGTIVVGGSAQNLGSILSTQQENTQQSQPQNVIQQFIANSNNQAGEFHQIQIGADGQLQLVKVAALDASQEQS